MRYKLSFKLENKEFPIEYHKYILSFIKYCISQYDEKYFVKLYNKKDPIIKPYTYSIYFNLPKFNSENIILNDKNFDMYFSVADYELAIIIYNAFNNQRLKSFSLNRNSMTLYNISFIQEKNITEDNIIIKFMSPLVARARNQQTKKDYYYSYNDEKFLETLKINIKEELKASNVDDKLVNDFIIESIKPKKTVVKFYEKQIECSLGLYKLIADKDLLKYLYMAGTGSKRSSGFGMFNIIG